MSPWLPNTRKHKGLHPKRPCKHPPSKVWAASLLLGASETVDQGSSRCASHLHTCTHASVTPSYVLDRSWACASHPSRHTAPPLLCNILLAHMHTWKVERRATLNPNDTQSQAEGSRQARVPSQKCLARGKGAAGCSAMVPPWARTGMHWERANRRAGTQGAVQHMPVHVCTRRSSLV